MSSLFVCGLSHDALATPIKLLFNPLNFYVTLFFCTLYTVTGVTTKIFSQFSFQSCNFYEVHPCSNPFTFTAIFVFWCWPTCFLLLNNIILHLHFRPLPMLFEHAWDPKLCWRCWWIQWEELSWQMMAMQFFVKSQFSTQPANQWLKLHVLRMKRQVFSKMFISYWLI